MPLIALSFSRSSQRIAPGSSHHSTQDSPRCESKAVDNMPATTSLKCMRGRRVLCLADSDNLDHSLAQRGLHLRHADLLRHLDATARKVFAVAVLTSPVHDTRRAEAWGRAGWRPIVVHWEWAMTCKGMRKLANADFDIAFEAGVLSSISGCDTILLATGDGDLAVSIARGLRRARQRDRLTIHTLSVTGATSARLRERTDLFDSSIQIGQDCLEPRTAANGWQRKEQNHAIGF